MKNLDGLGSCPYPQKTWKQSLVSQSDQGRSTKLIVHGV